MHSLLLGNGLNRLSYVMSWPQLLGKLAERFGIDDLVYEIDQKPLSLLFEEICARCGGKSFRATELAVKKCIAELMGEVPISLLHQQYLDLFECILTTNYDDTLERAISGPLFVRAHVMQESRYSLFRRCQAHGKFIWHIHGESASPSSMVLGYDHYAGYLQKIRNYLTDGFPHRQKVNVRSPLKSGVQEFERWGWHCSWVDHFLRNHVHIVALGLDFTEIDLWWLLVHKRRRKVVTGHTFFYHIHIDKKTDLPSSKLSALVSLGVMVHEVNVSTYQEGYAQILELMSENQRKYPALLESALPDKVERPLSTSVNASAPSLGRQLNFNVRSSKKRPK